MLSPRSDKDALIFSSLAEMKFKPAECPLIQVIKSQNQSPRQTTQFQHLQSPFINSLNPNHLNKQIKYLYSLNQSCFLIGNENQLDLIGINGASQGFLDTQHLWSMHLKELILNIAIDTKKCFLALVLEKTLQIYSYNTKKLNQLPKHFKTIELKRQIKFVQFAKQAYLTIFYQDYFEVYLMEENGKLIKKCQKMYPISRDLKIFAVPKAVDSVLNIFFEKETNQEPTFSIWSMKVVFDLVQIKLHPLLKVYDIMKSLKKKVKINNFSREIFFLNMGCEIIAAQKGFIIDSIVVNIQGPQSRLIYLPNEKLLHLNDKKVELYDIKIDETVKPNRIKIRSIDSLQLQEKPLHSKIIDVVFFGRDNFGIFFQIQPQFNNFTKGEINYWFSVTLFIKKDQKIRRIFNYGMEISKLSPQVIQSKCDMARKIGLQDKEIYLEIWNRTSKSTLEDYKFLLATKDYKTIYNQIEKKLKKQSMSFRQLFNIFQSCLDILSSVVYGRKQCTQQNIQQYLTCHLLVRKLKLFKQIEMYHRNQSHSKIHIQALLQNSQQDQQSSIFTITIQEFYEYKNFDIKGYLIDHVNMFCIEKKNTLTRIRLILRAFRFVYRVIYRQLLEQIILNSKTNLLTLLQAIPELLPYIRRVEEDQEVSLYEGIWSDISQSEWQSNLHLQKIKTLYNFDKLDEVIKSVWYKRHWLTSHDLISKTKLQILQIHHQNVSDEIFYFFISLIFLKIQDKRNRQVLVEFLENFYDNLPQHIRGKIFLYVDLWEYYCRYFSLTKRNKLNLHEFFKLKGSDLFKFYFDLQKVRKNCILKEIKPIYLQAKSEYAGIDVFNQGLLEYFESQMSQISDLKYLLNRMNNQKSQFHWANAQTYEILVQAMQIKLIIGGKNDIPIEEILIYIENIPLTKDNDLMAELQTVQRINEESQRFKQMKLNMSIREIIDNCEDVISKMIQYEFNKNKIKMIKKITELKKISYSLLAQIQTIKQKIYGSDMNNLPFFIYISQLLQNQDQIQLASQLLQDEYLNRYFTVNEIIIENLVLYMYKKRFSISSVFKDHAGYIQKLVSLLPVNNSTREFILNQVQFAVLLSAQGEQVEFPICKTQAFPKVNELIEIVKYLPAEYIEQVNIQRVYETMRTMQEIEIKNNEDEQNSLDDEYFDHEFISRHQVYEIFISRMIQLNLIQPVIPYIRKIISIDFKNKNYNSLYLILLVLKICPQLNDDTKYGLISLIGYAFEDQQKIIAMVEFYINTKMTSLEKGKLIANNAKLMTKDNLNFNATHGILFKEAFLQEISTKDPVLQHNASLLVKSSWHHLRNTKPQFQDPFYELAFIILCHQPYLLGKLIYLLIQTINFKQLRSFISYVSLQQIFDEFKVLEFSKRIFYIVLHSRIENQEINFKLFSYERVPLQEPVFFKQYHKLQDQTDIKLEKSLKACDNKSKLIINAQKNWKNRKESDQQSIHIMIHHPQNITDSSPSQYLYQDSDDDRDDEDLSLKKKPQQRTKRNKIQFDQKSERNKFMKRDGKKLGTYMKEHTDTENGSSQNINTASIHNGFKIKSRIATIEQASIKDKQSKLKRAMTLTYHPEIPKSKSKDYQAKTSPKSPNTNQINPKNNLKPQLAAQSSQLIQEELIPSTSQMRKKQSKRKISQSIFNSKADKVSEYKYSEIAEKQKSAYGTKQESFLRDSETTCENLLDELLEGYDAEKKEFKLEKLHARAKLYADQQQSFTEELRKLISVLYETIDSNGQLKMSLIKAISTTFQSTNIKPNILSVYIHLNSLIQRYNLNISIKRILTIQDLLSQTSLQNLFQSSKQKIIDTTTIQNLSKLSKVISLAFRKNIYEQEVAYLGLCKIINQVQGQKEIQEVEVNLYFDQFNQIVNKFSTKMLREKAETHFKEINDGPVKNRLIQLILTTIANKGDKLSVNALKKSLGLSSKEIK